MATKKKPAKPKGRGGSQQTAAQVKARGALRLGLYLNPERNALAARLAAANGVTWPPRARETDLIALWDLMARALEEKGAAEKP